MARPRLSTDHITREALEIVDCRGLDALTLTNVAERLDVGPSALYAHVEGLDGLRYLVAVGATGKLTAQVRNAAVGTSGDRALEAMGAAYRAFALDHPGQFASTLLPPNSEQDELAAANEALTDVFALVYTAMGLTGEDSGLAARSTRSAIHGFLALEHITGTHASHDDEYDHLIATLQRGLTEARAS